MTYHQPFGLQQLPKEEPEQVYPPAPPQVASGLIVARRSSGSSGTATVTVAKPTRVNMLTSILRDSQECFSPGVENGCGWKVEGIDVQQGESEVKS